MMCTTLKLRADKRKEEREYIAFRNRFAIVLAIVTFILYSRI